MVRLLLLILGLVVGTAGATDVYRWVDSNGEAHYSDTPREGAERITVEKAQTFSAPTARSVRRKTGDSTDEAGRYESFGISRPTADASIWGSGGEVGVSVEVTPDLQPEHQVAIFMDGQMVSQAAGELNFTLTDVDRGTHTLRAEIRDANGVSLIQSPPVAFTVHQQSEQNPNNPNAPPPPVVPTPLPTAPSG